MNEIESQLETLIGGGEAMPMLPPDPIQLPPDLTETELLAMCERQEKDFTDFFKDTIKDIEDNARLYKGAAAAGVLGSGPILPLVASIVDTQQARLMGQYFAQEKFFDLLPNGRSALDVPNAGDIASRVEDFLNEQIYDTPDFFQRMDKATRMLLIEDAIIARVRGEDEDNYKMSVVRQDLNGQPVPTSIDFEEQKKTGPVFDVDSIRSYAWDPRASLNIRKAKWVRHRTNVTSGEIDEWAKTGVINVDAAKRAKQLSQGAQNMSGNMGQDSKDPAGQYAKYVDGKNLPSGAWKDGLITVDEWIGYVCWGKDENVQSAEFVWWLVPDKQVLLKFGANTSKRLKRPFAMAILGQKQEGLLGQGPVDIVKPLIVKISNVMSAINKLMWQAANVPTFYEPSSMLDGRRTLLQDANLVPVMNAKAINRMEPPTTSIRLLQDYLNFLISQAREATASNEQAQGIGGGSDTATESQILAQSAGMRTQYTINLANAELTCQIAELYLEWFRENGVPGEMVTREAGVDGNPVEITPEDLALDYKVRPLSSVPQSNKLARFKELSAVVEKIAAIPPQMLTDAQGQPMKLNLYEFLSQDMLPLIDVRGGQRLFTRLALPPVNPMLGAGGVMPVEAAGGGMPNDMPPPNPELGA